MFSNGDYWEFECFSGEFPTLETISVCTQFREVRPHLHSECNFIAEIYGTEPEDRFVGLDETITHLFRENVWDEKTGKLLKPIFNLQYEIMLNNIRENLCYLLDNGYLEFPRFGQVVTNLAYPLRSIYELNRIFIIRAFYCLEEAYNFIKTSRK